MGGNRQCYTISNTVTIKQVCTSTGTVCVTDNILEAQDAYITLLIISIGIEEGLETSGSHLINTFHPG